MFKKWLKRKTKQTNQNNSTKPNEGEQYDTVESDCDTLLVHPTLSTVDESTNLADNGKFVVDNRNNSNCCSIIYQPNPSNYPNCCTNHMMDSLYKTNSKQPTSSELRKFRLDLYFKKYPPIPIDTKTPSHPVNVAATFTRSDRLKSTKIKAIPTIRTDKAKLIKMPPMHWNYVNINHKKVSRNAQLVRQSFQPYYSKTPTLITSDSSTRKTTSSTYRTCKENFTDSLSNEFSNFNIDATDSNCSSKLLSSSSKHTKIKQTLNESSMISSLKSTHVDNNILEELKFISSYLSNRSYNNLKIDDLTNITSMNSDSLKEKYRKNHLFYKCIDNIQSDTSFKLSSVASQSIRSSTKSRLPLRINQKAKYRVNSSSMSSMSFSSFLSDNTTISNFDDSEGSISLTEK